MRCYHGGLEGICVGQNDPHPIGYIKTDQRCEEKGDCRCFIPCKDKWPEKKCKKYAKKGICKQVEIAKNCCATCSDY